jgi:hypothetical protein
MGIEPRSVSCESKMLTTTVQVVMCRELNLQYKIKIYFQIDAVPSRDLEYLALGWGIRANLIFSNFKSTEEFLLSKIKIIVSRFALYCDH